MSSRVEASLENALKFQLSNLFGPSQVSIYNKNKEDPVRMYSNA